MQTQEIWEDFNNELLGFIKARINNVSIAEDILQDVFVKIHLNIKSIREEDKLTSWVYRITRNSIIDYYRRNKSLSTQGADETFEKNWADELGKSEKDFGKCLKSFIKQLPEKDRNALNQTAFGELTQKEYAIQEQLNYSAAKSRIQRAREKLKGLFVKCCGVEADKYGNIMASEKEDCNC